MTTPIIHPINEKKPELPCWIWTTVRTGVPRWIRYGHEADGHFVAKRFDQLPHFAQVAATHWTADSPLPPEVTPEQGKGETGWWCSSCQVFVPPKEVTYNETHDHRAGGCGTSVFQRKISPPASGPSPAACEVAKEITLRFLERRTPASIESAIAAIIDRKFPREEDGARLDWLDTLPKHGGWHISVNGYGHPHVSDAYHGTSIRAAIDSARAALQDSREGK